MKKLSCLFCLLLLASCTLQPMRTVEVVLCDEHYWEYWEGRPMWYTLSWFDGRSVQHLALAPGVKNARVRIAMGSTCPFTATPLDSLRPQGAVYVPGDGDVVRLCFEGGRLASLLLDMTSFDKQGVAALDAHALASSLPDDWDEDALQAAFLEGRLGQVRIPSAKRHDVLIEAIPSGIYVGEGDEDHRFQLEPGEAISLGLIPGVHRFYNRERRLVHMVYVYSDGRVSYHDYSLAGW